MPPRPRTVTYAALLLYALAALPVAFVLITVVLRDDLDKAAGPAGAITPVSLLPLSLIGGTLTVVLAVFVGKGRNWARILVWLLAG